MAPGRSPGRARRATADPSRTFQPMEAGAVMTSATEIPDTGRRTPTPERPPVRRRAPFVEWITSTDHKTIGYMYLISSFIFFCAGGVMALLIRAELFQPGMQILETRSWLPDPGYKILDPGCQIRAARSCIPDPGCQGGRYLG